MLTKKQKEALAFELWSKAGDLIEYWSELSRCDQLKDVSAKEAAAQIVIWFSRLPGNTVDLRVTSAAEDLTKNG